MYNKKFDEAIQKLPPLKKIEFLLKKQNLGSLPIYPILTRIILIFIFYFAFAAIFDLQLISMNLEPFAFILGLNIFIIALLMALFVDIIILLLYMKEAKRLREEFFSFDINIKKKTNGKKI